MLEEVCPLQARICHFCDKATTAITVIMFPLGKKMKSKIKSKAG